MPRVLETERLILRQFRPADAADVNSFADDPDYRRYLGPEHPNAREFLANNIDADWDRAPSWAIELDGRVIGGVFLGVDRGEGRAELACLVAPTHWRRGIAVEACRVVVDHAFAAGLTQLWARAHVDNAASIATMERIGMRRDGRDEKYVRFVIDRALPSRA